MGLWIYAEYMTKNTRIGEAGVIRCLDDIFDQLSEPTRLRRGERNGHRRLNFTCDLQKWQERKCLLNGVLRKDVLAEAQNGKQSGGIGFGGCGESGGGRGGGGDDTGHEGEVRLPVSCRCPLLSLLVEPNCWVGIHLSRIVNKSKSVPATPSQIRRLDQN